MSAPYPDCIIARLLYVGRHFAIFLPHAKGSVTKERKGYERIYPGVNAHVFAMLDNEKAKP